MNVSLQTCFDNCAASEFRRRQADLPSRPYELLSAANETDVTIRNADAIMRGRWSNETDPRVRLESPIPWDALAEVNRSRCFDLHCWDPLGPLLAAFCATGEYSYVRTACSIALDWVHQYPSLATQSAFAWYDMAVGIRAYRLAYIVDVAARSDDLSREDFAKLLTSAQLHQSVLADDSRFAAHSNHGFYFAAGQLVLAKRLPSLPLSPAGMRQAVDRLRQTLETQFSEEGVHREHSPDYHRMVYDTFASLVSSGLLEGDELREHIERIEDAFAWFVLPNGRLAMFGDTPHRLFVVRRGGTRFTAPSLQFVASGGSIGVRPARTARFFPASGYAVVRSGWELDTKGPGKASYLAQSCAFHSRVHKHADDLSFVWYDRGQELLVDAGRYGYLGRTDPGSSLWEDGHWYSDPNRVYVESTRAHNAVEIDSRNYARRGVRPYGSALKRWGEWAGVYYIESEIRHWRTLRHVRVLLFRPAEWLIVFDWLWDNAGQKRDFKQWFQFAPELDVMPQTAFLESPLQGGEILYTASLLPAEMIAPVKGQREPELQGWTSRQDGEMTPCWSGGFMANRVSNHTFATLFTIGQQPPLVAGDASSVSRDGRKALLRWQANAIGHAIEILRPKKGSIRLDYRIAISKHE